MKLKVILWGATIALASCSQSYDEQMFDVKSDELSATLTASDTSLFENELQFSSWKDCLDYFVDGSGADWLQNQGIKLTGYELLRENIAFSDSDFAVSDECIVPIYNDTCNVNEFELMTIADARNIVESYKMIDYSIFKRTLVSHYKGQKLSLVKLNWEYKSLQYTTNCIVSPRAVVYDDLLLNIREVASQKEEPAMPVALNLSRSESSYSIDYFFFSDEVTWSVLGAEVARAFCTVDVNGNESAKGKSIESYDENGYTTSKVGFKALADVNITGFERGTSGHCSFTFGIAAGPAGISMSISGNTVSFSGGGNTRDGSQYVTPSMLN